MKTITYSYFKKHFDSILDQVNEDHVAVLITPQKGKPVVIMSLEDYQWYEERAYLVGNLKAAS